MLKLGVAMSGQTLPTGSGRRLNIQLTDMYLKRDTQATLGLRALQRY